MNQVQADADMSELSELGRLSDLSVTVKKSAELDFISKCTSLHKLTIKIDFISSGDELPSLKKLKSLTTLIIDGGKAVSYTHLDVYKRQIRYRSR